MLTSNFRAEELELKFGKNFGQLLRSKIFFIKMQEDSFSNMENPINKRS